MEPFHYTMPIGNIESFCAELTRMIENKRMGRATTTLATLQNMYQFIFKLSATRTKESGRLILDAYMAFINKIPVCMTREKVEGEISLINNSFAYPLRSLVVVRQNEAVWQKRDHYMTIFLKYLIITGIAIPNRDVLKYIGSYIIELDTYPEIKDNSLID